MTLSCADRERDYASLLSIRGPRSPRPGTMRRREQHRRNHLGTQASSPCSRKVRHGMVRLAEDNRSHRVSWNLACDSCSTTRPHRLPCSHKVIGERELDLDPRTRRRSRSANAISIRERDLNPQTHADASSSHRAACRTGQTERRSQSEQGLTFLIRPRQDAVDKSHSPWVAPRIRRSSTMFTRGNAPFVRLVRARRCPRLPRGNRRGPLPRSTWSHQGGRGRCSRPFALYKQGKAPLSTVGFACLQKADRDGCPVSLPRSHKHKAGRDQQVSC